VVMVPVGANVPADCAAAIAKGHELTNSTYAKKNPKARINVFMFPVR
jgi:hypothetical protein